MEMKMLHFFLQYKYIFFSVLDKFYSAAPDFNNKSNQPESFGWLFEVWMTIECVIFMYLIFLKRGC